MSENGWLAEQFEENRGRMKQVALRLLGSAGEADDAVQETWLRLQRTDARDVENLSGWLTTVIARVCLDVLRARKVRREALDTAAVDLAPPQGPTDPERDAVLADAIGPALLVVLDTLGPAERIAFVLHDMFDLPFDDIAGILGRSVPATRQLASRARRRVRGVEATGGADLQGRRALVEAFLAASRDGDLDRLIAVLAPDAVLDADEDAVRTAERHGWGGSAHLPSEAQGARAVAEVLKGRAHGVRLALIDGDPGAALWIKGALTAAWLFRVESDAITEIHLVMGPERLAALEATAASA